MHNFIGPIWFYEYGKILEVLFAFFAITVSFFSYKVYRFTLIKNAKYFTIGFLFIALSNLLHIFITLFGMYLMNPILMFKSFFIFNITGYVILTYMTLKIKSLKTLFLIEILSILLLVFNDNIIFYYGLNSLFLIYITFFYFKNYLNHMKFNVLLILLTFLFMLFANIHFLFPVNHELFYVIGYFFNLVAYLFIMANLFMVCKKC